MTAQYTIRRRVEFSETDMAGIVHFSCFFRYMEAAEHAFFRSLGLSIVTRLGDRAYGWPRVHAECDFTAPVRFEDELEVTLEIRAIRKRSLVYDFHFARLTDQGQREPVATGSITTVCVTKDGTGRMTAVEIPDAVVERIRAASVERSI